MNKKCAILFIVAFILGLSLIWCGIVLLLSTFVEEEIKESSVRTDGLVFTKEPSQVLLTITDEGSFLFFNPEGDIVGEIDSSGEELIFHGNVDESAKSFFRALKALDKVSDENIN